MLPRNRIYSETYVVWAADIIPPAGIHFLCNALRYNKPDKSKYHIKVRYVIQI